MDKNKHKKEGPLYYYVFNSLLIGLLVLHIYWWVLIFRMLVKQIQARGKLGEDVRSGLCSLVYIPFIKLKTCLLIALLKMKNYEMQIQKARMTKRIRGETFSKWSVSYSQAS